MSSWPRYRQVPALLLLLHRRDARPVLPPRADLGAVRLQFYFNGHSPLARDLQHEGIGFVRMTTPSSHRRHAARPGSGRRFSPDACTTPQALRALAVSGGRRVRPGVGTGASVRPSTPPTWCFAAGLLVPLYDALSRQAMFAATRARGGLSGQEDHAELAQEIGSRLSTRMEGRCIKHYMGAAGDEGLRQVLPGVAGGDHRQRRELFQAPPQGGTQARHASWRR